jgi:heterodisulfide reductase subunit D
MERIAGWRRLGTPAARLVSLLTRSPSSEADECALFTSLSRCTSCGACSVVCESGISCTALWESMMGAGRDLGFCDPRIEEVAEAIAETGNPFGDDDRERTAWIPEGIEVAEAAPVGLFVGCTAAFRQPELARAAVRVLERSGTRFCMTRESCCGSFLVRTGSRTAHADAVRAMIEDLRVRGVTTLLVLCAGCLRTITLDWPRWYGGPLPFRTMPFSVHVRSLVREGRLRFADQGSLRVAYHDPCHGGRHLMHRIGREWAFEAPREVLVALPGVVVVEFAENREHQLCCGAGGGIRALDPALALSIAGEKVSAGDGMRADCIASTCPFCRRNLDDACRSTGSSLEVLDLVQLVDRMAAPSR